MFKAALFFYCLYTSLWLCPVLHWCCQKLYIGKCGENDWTQTPQNRYQLFAHTPWALQVERRNRTITKPAHVNGACLSVPQHRQSCQSLPSRVPLIWPRSNARRDMTGGPSAMGITRLAEMRQTNLSSSPATLILFFSPLLSVVSQLFFLTLINTFVMRCELFTPEL